MNRPLLDKDDIITKLRETCNELEPIVEVSGLYPADDTNVAYGLYVDDVDYASREPHKLGFDPCGSVYIATDSFKILYVSYQNDPQRETIEAAIADMASDSRFFDGYHQVTFNEDSDLGTSKSKRITYTFELKRINFNA